MKTIRAVYCEGGLKAVILRGMKKLMLPVVRMGGLIFVECDLRRPFQQQRDLRGIVAREANAADANLFENPDVFLARHNAGQRCFVGIDAATGKLANYCWITTSSGYIPEIDRYVVLKPGEVYGYDLKTLPEFRRRGIDTYARTRKYQRLRDQGFSKVYACIHADNVPMLRSFPSLMKPVGRIWYLQLRGSRCHVFGGAKPGLPELRTTAVHGEPDALAAATAL